MIIAMFRTIFLTVLFCATGHATVITRARAVGARSKPVGACDAGAAGPHELAQSHGKYFGTATAVGQWSDQPYTSILDDTSIFGSLTPALGMKVRHPTRVCANPSANLRDSGMTQNLTMSGSTGRTAMPLLVVLAQMVCFFDVMRWSGHIKRYRSGSLLESGIVRV